jgi:hypothetical protein
VHRKLDCRLTHTIPFPCRSTKGLDCVFPIWFTQCGRVWFTHVMPFPCHAMNMPFWKRLLKAAAGERHGMCELVSENGRVVAWERHGMCELALNSAEEPYGNGMVCINRPLICPWHWSKFRSCKRLLSGRNCSHHNLIPWETTRTTCNLYFDWSLGAECLSTTIEVFLYSGSSDILADVFKVPFTTSSIIRDTASYGHDYFLQHIFTLIIRQSSYHLTHVQPKLLSVSISL